MRTEVAVIGAGLSGLSTCRLLRAMRVDFLLLEGRGRLGGRILSVDATGRPSDDGFDLGPSWYCPEMQPAIGKLVEELSLPAFAQNSEGDVIFERMSREPSKRYRALDQGYHSMRLVGGTGALVRALSAHVPPDRLLLDARVTGMALNSDGVTLTLLRGEGRTDKLTAEHVIAALPPRLLEATIMLMPPVEETTLKRWRSTPTWMAPHAKFFALYKRPFWREAGLSGTAQSMVGPMIEMHDATIASGNAALFGFIGTPAERRAVLGEEGTTRMCLDQFARIFGAEARSPRATLLKDWAANPLTATAADQTESGHVMRSNEPWVNGAW